MKLIQLFFFSALLLITHLSFAAETISYKNERGSLLTIQFGPNNSISGNFITAVASKDCQKAIGQKKPIIGFIAKNAIAFTVSYPECGAVVSFTGNLEDNQKIIDTIAIVVHQSSHIATEGPGARMIGHDLFKEIS